MMADGQGTLIVAVIPNLELPFFFFFGAFVNVQFRKDL